MNTAGVPDGTTVVHTTRCGGNEELTTVIIEAIAAVEGIDPIDLDVRIGAVVDPDALNTLFGSSSDRACHVTFPLAGYLVRVFATDEITVYQP